MPLHLLGKKSWNVYSADNIARVRADEAAAAARETADEQHAQEHDAQRRAALLRGHTPPPVPTQRHDPGPARWTAPSRSHRGQVPKRRKLAGEDDTQMEIRIAAAAAPGAPRRRDEDAAVVTLRTAASDAPLTNHAGNIDLFPVDQREGAKREKNAELAAEKRKKEEALEAQYTMRFSNAAGREGRSLSQPWYASLNLAHPRVEAKDAWDNEDPHRQDRAQARIASQDPFAVMQQAQAQLKKSKHDKKKWAVERDRHLQELRAAQEREDRRSSHYKRKRRHDHDTGRQELHASGD